MLEGGWNICGRIEKVLLKVSDCGLLEGTVTSNAWRRCTETGVESVTSGFQKEEHSEMKIKKKKKNSMV
jgi:hypothetical protein